MKKIGLVGGISWSSTLDYYRYINEETNKIMGGLNYAECIIYSVNFEQFRKFNAAHDWDATFALLANAATQLENAGAEVIILGANTAHIVADRVREKIQVPLIDIRDVLVQNIQAKGFTTVGLLGTKYTMEMDFYKKKLADNNIEVITPQRKEDGDFIEHTLLYELGKGILVSETKKVYLQIIAALQQSGAQAIILGCTEIPLLIKQEDLELTVFDSTQLHARAAVEFALSQNK